MTDYADLEIDSTFPFGKVKGQVIRNILNENKSYLKWVVDNTEVKFSEEVLELIESTDPTGFEIAVGLLKISLKEDNKADIEKFLKGLKK